ncbi:AMP-binding protein, partial [Paracoccaceae bacterium]|nr:AMP-binding protein [Paracoccaceae bacterium]
MSMKIVSDFISHAKNMPKHPAVVERNKVTTYGEMLEIANRVSNYLTKNFARPRVVIDLPQSADAYAVMFGVLMSGGCYSPLNFDAPHYRKKLIVERFKPDIVICHDIEECTAEIDLNYVSLESIPLTNGVVPNYENGPAYVMFTSGSTGIPKGVSIPRSALDHYIQWAVSTFEITPADRLSQHPNLGFDLSVLDIFMGLSAGATLYPLTTTADRIFPVKFIHENQLTVWSSVPSVIDLFNKMPNVTPSHLSSLRLLSFCGEPLLARHLDALFCLAPDAAVQNTYGPTEATVSCTHVAMNRYNYKDFCHGEKVSLGSTIGEMSIHLHNVDVNGIGEIVICGPQVASEYWNDGKKTKASFFERSRGEILERCYLTGDLG